MSEVYRKWGEVVRFENGTIIHVGEAGQATEDAGVFQAAPLSQRNDPSNDQRNEQRTGQRRDLPAAANAFIKQVTSLSLPVSVERIIVTAGAARHEVNGTVWTEESQRAHISLVNPPLRALIDLASFDAGIVGGIAAALARAAARRETPSRLRLAPNVAAALLPSLIADLAMEQRSGLFDGRGQPIETRAVTGDPPPNWYRPSYAIRPVRAWFNLRALPFGSIDRSTPLAVALLTPVDGTTLHLLCVEGDAAFPATVDASHISAVSGHDPEWYPYAAGSFGAEMML